MRFSCPHCDAKDESYLAVCAHVTERHPEQTFLCGRRAEGGASVMGESRDHWRVEPNGDRCCSYCGSLHEEDFTAIMEGFVEGKEGFEFGTTTKAYKVYARRPGVSNATEGGIKFYGVHADNAHPDFPRRAELYDKAVKLANERLRARFSIPAKPAPIADPAARASTAEGCCSSISPCSHQQRDPFTICETCARARSQV